MKLVKFLVVSLILFSYIIVSSIINFCTRHNRKISSKIASFYATVLLKVLNIRVKVNNVYEDDFLLVSNHLSYIDILVLSSVCPSIFITSKEIEQENFLGLLSRLNNSVFVERRNYSTLLKDNEKIISVLNSKIPVILFAEGTSSNGDQVLPFKSSLFYCVEKYDIIVQPVCIKYKKINNEPVTQKNRDSIYYYGSMNFFPHFWNLFSLKSIDIEITFLKDTYSNSRKESCKLAYQQISKHYMEPS